MTHYYTASQEKQVQEFVDRFIEKVKWMATPDGVESLSDKATTDSGSISEEAMVRWFIMFGFDQADDIGVSGNDLHDLIVDAILIWARQSFDQDNRDALRPLYERHVNP